MSRQVNITYKGIQNAPSSVSDADGSAAECVNLAQDGTDLKPMPMPICEKFQNDDLIKVEQGCILVSVHNVQGEKHFIEYNRDNYRLYFVGEDASHLYTNNAIHYWSNKSEVLSIECVGNTVVVSTKDGIEYFYWNMGEYKYIGQKPPMPIIQFECIRENDVECDDIPLYTTIKDGNSSRRVLGIAMSYEPGLIGGESLNVSLNSYSTDSSKDTYYKNAEMAFRDNVAGKISSIENTLSSMGGFNRTFFVRYALRMKDGNYILHSQPYMMIIGEDNPYICEFEEISEYDSLYGINIKSRCYSLLYRCVGYDNSECGSSAQNTTLEDWEDIIDSVDIFISQQMDTLGVDYKSKINVSGILNETDNKFYLNLPNISHDDFYDNVRSLSNLYFIKSLRVGDDGLSYDSVGNVLHIDTTTLMSRKTLKDDYLSHCMIRANISHGYNSRINLANLSLFPYKGYDIRSYNEDEDGNEVSFYFRLVKNGKEIIVGAPNYTYKINDEIDYIFYPDPDCTDAFVYYKLNDSYMKLKVKMSSFEALNGVFFYDVNGIPSEYEIVESLPYISNEECWYDLQNRFSMSAASNPFYFPVDNMFDIGKREIRAIAVNTEDISNAQYGQNPIYIFCSDGVWTMKISGDGTFGGLSPLSADVISRVDRIDSHPFAVGNQFVFFVTNKGLMAVSGSQVKEVGLKMHGKSFNALEKLQPQYSVYTNLHNIGLQQMIMHTSNSIYAEYMNSASLIWDYKHNRVLAINANSPYALAYDALYDFWAKMYITDDILFDNYTHMSHELISFIGCVGNYTEAYLQDNNGYIWNLMGDSDENGNPFKQLSFYVSRPMLMGSDSFKSIMRISHRCVDHREGEMFKMALYGSRDGINYYKINTMRGASYRYFVVVFYGNLYPSSRYASTAVELQDRLTNRLR